MEEPRIALAGPWSIVLTSLCCLLAFFATPVLAAPAEAQASAAEARKRSGGGFHFKRAERCFMRKINRRRAAHGLDRLRWDRQIGYVARRHARRMARAGSVSHDGWLTARITNWRALGQNSGRGEVCRTLFKAFWRSAHHRRNILGRWRYVGVGTRHRGGTLYVQQVFEYRSNPGNIWGWP